MVVAIVFLSVGSGAFKTTVVPFIGKQPIPAANSGPTRNKLLTCPVADQYEETEFRIKTLKSGEKVVTSRELTITYIYNAFYW
jgi:proton-dependent oligopeptide transporter, POT family